MDINCVFETIPKYGGIHIVGVEFGHLLNNKSTIIPTDQKCQ